MTNVIIEISFCLHFPKHERKFGRAAFPFSFFFFLRPKENWTACLVETES